MTDNVEILRYAAFTHDPKGGNPAGVVLISIAEADGRTRVSGGAVVMEASDPSAGGAAGPRYE
ncbi:hypothetical protein FHR32_004746 [Streptosporangium album]|uniref:PhzF family phenazine biosynthesis protein n=1 Tax=Streptosporangium album TaxID=47479 RepID=A0A7W7WAW8_9ACTN|nr:hypothetical protein [Streptosporangium album]MBB4940441.1 hypothetical protein [Streptosporangium album]